MLHIFFNFYSCYKFSFRFFFVLHISFLPARDVCDHQDHDDGSGDGGHDDAHENPLRLRTRTQVLSSNTKHRVILKKIFFCTFKIILFSKEERSFTRESKDKGLTLSKNSEKQVPSTELYVRSFSLLPLVNSGPHNALAA